MISWLEWHAADAKRYDGSRMRMDDALDAGESFEETLVNESLARARRTHVLVTLAGGIAGGRCILQIEFVDVCRRADERWRHPVAGHEKGGVVKGVANADMTVAGDDGVIVKDMVGCDQKRKRLGEVGHHFDG